MKFEDLGFSENILKAIEECGYTEPTPIQAKAIPHVLMTRDVVGLAQTGTGKTASFTLPMIEILAGGRAKARMPRSLILAPTRELAAQVADNFETYGKYCNLSMALLTGGTSMGDQIKALERGVDVLIATPGRLLDLFERGQILLTDIKILVIDEADRMLDMGFIPDIEKIVSKLPPMRQTLFFSATMDKQIKKLTEKFLDNPREVSVAPPATTSGNVEQFIVRTTGKGKGDSLLKILAHEDVKNAYIFCNRKRDIGGLYTRLKRAGYSAGQWHGDMTQAARTEVLEQFKSGEVTLLVCSDVAARGIDVSGVSHVFNYDIPNNPDDYVHRIGRTGRAGQKGQAWTFIAGKDDEEYLEAVQKRISKDIPEAEGFAKAASKPNKKEEKDKSKEAKSGSKSSASKDKTTKKNKHGEHRAPSLKQDSQDNVVGFGDEMPAFFNKK